jgi:hypothetical protein
MYRWTAVAGWIVAASIGATAVYAQTQASSGPVFFDGAPGSSSATPR